jgi:hypothetical protein
MSNIRRIAALALAGAALTAVGTGPASAVTGPSASDRQALREGNRMCAVVTDEVSFEECVIGEVAIETGRAVLGDGYHTNNGIEEDLDAQWMATLIGDFIIREGRFIREDQVTWNAKGQVVLVGRSQHIQA